jgi:hypothetical protein
MFGFQLALHLNIIKFNHTLSIQINQVPVSPKFWVKAVWNRAKQKNLSP